ncbi:response regulator [Yersinia rochesterensis]|uniref:response regulator n=1 Tax=Yersinia rochesterensis TaxID=1604335 RepID=UPI0025AA8EFF|nr:response regulator [Yersinia rochesterensis]MDN0108835.1 response regulator [Yersinia rochesterensis]MDR5018916.1 response regulator [Yersinia rochesterensis]
MKSVLIVDDHPVARFAIRVALEKEFLTIIGETDNGLKAISIANHLTPDLIIMDIDIPPITGIEVVFRLRKKGYNGMILMLTSKDDDHYIKRSASAGANGFISKSNSLDTLSEAIRILKKGYNIFPKKNINNEAIQLSDCDEKDKITSLSYKELQVLKYLSRGYRVVDIAIQMNISDKTVSTYKRRLMLKLEINNMIELLNFTLRHNLD